MKKKLIIPILALLITVPLMAQEPFLGEIKMFAGNFAPRGWAFCDGQILSIAQNTALFSLLGTTYGGDGRTTFALPDLRGRVTIHAGYGPGLSPKRLGEKGGVEAVALTVAQMPNHNHAAQIKADSTVATTDSPIDMFPARNAGATPQYGDTLNTVMNSTAVSVGNTGGSQAHTNVQPYNTVYYIICIQGYFPSRN